MTYNMAMRKQQEFIEIVCTACGHVYDIEETTTLLNESPERRTGCSECKQVSVRMEKTILEEPVAVYEMLDYKLKGAESKPLVKGKVGDELYHDTGEWHHVARRFDRPKDTYDEVIADVHGGIVREVHEPLSEHTDRGNAKKPKRRDL
jgi:hypothetical protein